MTNDQIRAIFLAHGFKEKDQGNGVMDLNPYVYEAARALLAAPRQLDPDTVVCRRYQMPTAPGRWFYHYDVEPAFGSVPVTLGELLAMVPKTDQQAQLYQDALETRDHALHCLEEGRQEVERFKEANEQLSAENVRRRNECERLRTACEKESASVQALNDENQRLRLQAGGMQMEIDELRASLEGYQQGARVEAEAADEARAEVKKLQAQLHDKELLLAACRGRRAELEAQWQDTFKVDTDEDGRPLVKP